MPQAKKQRQSVFSLNQPINNQEGDRQEPINLLQAPEHPMDQQLKRELQEYLQQIITSEKWQHEHPKNRPNFNLSEYVRLKLLEKTNAEIAQILGISAGYVGSHYERKFQPILQELLQDFR